MGPDAAVPRGGGGAGAHAGAGGRPGGEQESGHRPGSGGHPRPPQPGSSLSISICQSQVSPKGPCMEGGAHTERATTTPLQPAPHDRTPASTQRTQRHSPPTLRAATSPPAPQHRWLCGPVGQQPSPTPPHPWSLQLPARPPAPSHRRRPRRAPCCRYLAAPGLLGAQVPVRPGVPVPPAARRRAPTQVAGDVGSPLARPPPAAALGGLPGQPLLGRPGVGHLPHPHDVLRGPVLLVHAGRPPEGAQPLHLRRHHRVASRALLHSRPVTLDSLRQPRGASAVAGGSRRAGGSAAGRGESGATLRRGAPGATRGGGEDGALGIGPALASRRGAWGSAGAPIPPGWALG